MTIFRDIAARATMAVLLLVLLAGCETDPQTGRRQLPDFLQPATAEPPPPVIRQPVLPEMLVGCRGHVLVPALGMTFVPRNATPPENGQFLREERLTAPYRIVPPGAILTRDHSPARLNVELDKYRRVIGLYCG